MGVIAEAWTWLTTGANWSGDGGAAHRLAEHLYVSGIALSVACLIALPVALYLGHVGKGAGSPSTSPTWAGRCPCSRCWPSS